MSAFDKQQTLKTFRAQQDLQQAVWDMSEKNRIYQHDAHVQAYDDYCIKNLRYV